MSLRKLGKSRKQEVMDDQTFTGLQEELIKQLQRFNDYMALMTNEPEPPTETDEVL